MVVLLCVSLYFLLPVVAPDGNFQYWWLIPLIAAGLGIVQAFKTQQVHTRQEQK